MAGWTRIALRRACAGLGLALATAGCAGGDRPAPAPPPVSALRAPQPVEPEAYRIGTGDQISVTFPYNAELNQAGPVGPDGRFAVPVVGNLLVAGKTLDETAALIGAALRRGGVVENARATVSVQQYGGVIYVGGEVRLPGAVRLTGGMDPLQAVIAAGGLLDTARSKQIVVIHRTLEGAIVQSYADLRSYTRHGVPTNVALQSQDIVFVPKSSIAEADLWVDQYINKLLPFSRSLNYSLGSTAVRSVVSQ